MYIHENEGGKNKYFIGAIIFHIAVISIVFFLNTNFKEENDSNAPPESSTSNASELSEENTMVDEELLENTPENEVAEHDKKLNANAVSSKEVNKAIENFNDNIKKQEEEKIAEKKRVENERLEAIQKEKVRKEEVEKALLLKKEAEEKEKSDAKEKAEKESLAKKNKEKELKLKKQKEEAEAKKRDLKEKELNEQKKKEALEKSIKAEAERKKKSAEAVRNSAIAKQKAEQARRNSLNNRGYDSTKKSLSNNEKLAMLKLYRDQVYNKVYGNWIRPSYSKRGWECKVHVTQSNSGEVKNVKFIKCQGDANFQESVKKAIFKSSPLPLPKHPSLFNSTIEITFKVT